MGCMLWSCSGPKKYPLPDFLRSLNPTRSRLAPSLAVMSTGSMIATNLESLIVTFCGSRRGQVHPGGLRTIAQMSGEKGATPRWNLRHRELAILICQRDDIRADQLHS